MRRDILQAVGRTPLVRLNKVAVSGGAAVLAKCEFVNPTGSVKDRMALHILLEAEREGRLAPGGTIVENTSGNTGLGLAMVAAVRGYRCIFTMPDKMSREKADMLRAYGARVVITPTDVPGDSPEHYVNVARRIAAETPGSFYVDQYHNPANIDAHYLATGPEIWEQTEGTIDAFVAGPGTGGTLSGVGRLLKEKRPDVRIVGADPIGSVHFQYFYTGTLPTPHVYQVEGVGEDILCGAMDFGVVDEIRQVDDVESFRMARRLVREEGLFCGGSSGSNVCVALEVARELGPEATVVTVLPDSATRYLTKHLSDAWMAEQGLEEGEPDRRLVEDLLSRHVPRPVATVRRDAPLAEARRRLDEAAGEPLIVLDEAGRATGVVDGEALDEAARSGAAGTVGDLARPAAGLIYRRSRLEELRRLFAKGLDAIVVDERGVLGRLARAEVASALATA